jgi:hypothetical protein
MKNNMLENFRRLWPIILVWTLFDLIAGPFMLILLGDDDSIRRNMFSLFTQGSGGAFLIFVNIVFTFIIGIAVFRYAHSPSAITVMHSLPIRRRTLFLSNWLSGLSIIAIPQLITALCLLPFAKPSLAHLFTSRAELAKIGTEHDWGIGATINAEYHTDVGDILHYLIITFVVLFFVYALTVFAGVITGTAPLHMIAAVLLNAAAPLVYLLVTTLLSAFLYGYVWGTQIPTGISWLHPLILFNDSSLKHTVPMEVLSSLLFIGIGLVFSFAGLALYTKLKSEKVGRPFTFEVAEYVFVILVTLLGMTVCALFFAQLRVYSGDVNESLRNFRVIFYVGALVGAIATYLVATMIARKTAKIFNARLLKNFGIYAICAVMFLAFTTTDIMGYSKRVPSVSAVSNVKISWDTLNVMPYRWWYGEKEAVISEADGLNYAAALHELIVTSDMKYAPGNDNSYTGVEYVEDKDTSYTFEESTLSRISSGGSLRINYKKRGGGTIARAYALTEEIEETEQFKNLIGSKGWLEATTIEKLCGYERLKAVYLSLYDAYNHTLTNGKTAYERKLTDEEIRELAGHLDADYVKLKADDLISRNLDDELFTFGFEMKSKIGDFEVEDIFAYSVTAEYKGTIAWLKEKGYYDDMISAAKQLRMDGEAVYKDSKTVIIK